MRGGINYLSVIPWSSTAVSSLSMSSSSPGVMFANSCSLKISYFKEMKGAAANVIFAIMIYFPTSQLILSCLSYFPWPISVLRKVSGEG